MENRNRWEKKAKLLYEGTSWEKAAIAAGKAMDNRLHTIAKDLFGQAAESGMFDIQQWLAWFDPEVLKNRKLSHKQHLL